MIDDDLFRTTIELANKLKTHFVFVRYKSSRLFFVAPENLGQSKEKVGSECNSVVL